MIRLIDLLREDNTPGYVTAEEQQLLQRVGNWNYFKTNPGNPWEDSKFRESVQNIKIKDIIYLESPSDEKLSKLGNYITKGKFNSDWDTDFPVGINYKGKIYLLDGHHRVELAKRAGKSTIKVAVKNINNKYEDVIEEVKFTPNKHIKQEALQLVDFLNNNKDLKRLKAKVNIHGSLGDKEESNNDIDIALWEDEIEWIDLMKATEELESERAKNSTHPALEVVIEQLEKLGFNKIKDIPFPQGDIYVIRFKNNQNNIIELWFANPN
jgi:hypothetical protein